MLLFNNNPNVFAQTLHKGMSTANGVTAVFHALWGKRIIDSYSNNVIREAKYGYQGLSQFIQQEIYKDVWIILTMDTSISQIGISFVNIRFIVSKKQIRNALLHRIGR